MACEQIVDQLTHKMAAIAVCQGDVGMFHRVGWYLDQCLMKKRVRLNESNMTDFVLRARFNCKSRQ
jgi:hypothetical protein